MGIIPPLRDKGYTHERKSNAGHKWIDPLTFFKAAGHSSSFSI
jgi:hypothetical protein